MAKYFFPASRDAAEQITALFNFVWPTTAALWNLRWQVSGFLDATPDATVAQLNARFVFGSGVAGADLRRSCRGTDWEEQKARFASLILVNVFAVYENWADEMASALQVSPLRKAFQFPDSARIGGKGVEWLLAHLTINTSSTLSVTYYPIFKSSSKYSLNTMSNMMLAYRYFKEIRNCEMHSSRGASQGAEAAYQAFLPVSDKESLGMKGDLDIEPIIIDEPVGLKLRGVVGFCDIVLRIIATIDAELCRSKQAEAIFRRMLKGAKGQPKLLSGNVKRRRDQVKKFCLAAGLPEPANTEAAYRFLKSENIIHV